jgi:hypothetical protein
MKPEYIALAIICGIAVIRWIALAVFSRGNKKSRP